MYTSQSRIIYDNNLVNPQKELWRKLGPIVGQKVLACPVLKHTMYGEGLSKEKCVYVPHRDRLRMICEAIGDKEK